MWLEWRRQVSLFPLVGKIDCWDAFRSIASLNYIDNSEFVNTLLLLFHSSCSSFFRLFFFRLPFQGYHFQREYIVTQGPLRTTMDEFWCMVWQFNSSIIVMMSKLIENNTEKVFQVSAKDGKVLVGNGTRYSTSFCFSYSWPFLLLGFFYCFFLSGFARISPTFVFTRTINLCPSALLLVVLLTRITPTYFFLHSTGQRALVK